MRSPDPKGPRSCCWAGRRSTARVTSGGTSCRRPRSASSRPRPTGAMAASPRCRAIRSSFRCRSGNLSPDRGRGGPRSGETSFLLDVPEHDHRRDDVAADGVAPRHRLLELAERDGDAFAEDARLDLLGDLELLLGLALADELHPEFLDLLVERPAELGAIAARLGIVVVDG